LGIKGSFTVIKLGKVNVFGMKQYSDYNSAAIMLDWTRGKNKRISKM